jgi:phage terminase large subunit
MTKTRIILKPFQDKFLFSRKRFPAIVAGVGSGKTYMLLLKAWSFCEKYPNSLGLIVRKEYVDLRDSTIQDFKTYFGVDIDSQEKSFTFPNKSKLIFRHGTVTDINTLKNINLSFAFIEQAEEYETDEVFTFLRDRLRRQNAPYRQLGLIANARGHNWIWEKWVQPAEVSVIDEPSGQRIYEREEFLAVTANSFVNKDVLPADFIADLQAMEKDSPNHYKQYVLNSFEDLEEDDLLFDFRELKDSEEVEFFDYAQVKRVMAVDIARYGGDKNVATIIESRGTTRWEQVYIESWHNKDLMHTTGRILDIYKRMKVNYLIVDGDGMGAGVVDRIKEQNFKIKEFRAGIRAKKPEDYKNRRSEGYMALKDRIRRGLLKIKPHPRQNQDLLSIRYQFNSKGQKEILSKEKMRKNDLKSPDFADALMMAIAECDYTETPAFNKKNLPRLADSEAQLM